MTNAGVVSERVPAAYGIWSVVAAVGSLLIPSAVVRIWLSLATSGPSDDRWSAALTMSNRVGLAIGWAIAVGAVVLGVMSIRRAMPRVGQPGRTRALVLGWIGVGIAILLGLFFFPLGLVGT
ncbi:hypothetical protein [Microbacterium sp. SS28]|uniref:hypothetical protein n=1 Tax=Microbacterium sp. SS28 TaxID=2919948 RepID=UPI001FAA5E9E|nr:hypothetical protein [Microbacterium sp. SS28]